MKQRLQKLISSAGIASRRAAEELIASGRVSINGERAEVGMSADPECDEITVDGEALRFPRQRTYIMLNKPAGYVTTLADEKGRKTVSELVYGAGERLYPVGRLDMWSEGLLIMTNDGEIANKLMHPSHNIKKVYNVSVSGTDIDGALKLMRQPMEIDGYTIKPAEVSVITRAGNEALLEIKISEGRNRQIRRMCEIAELHVAALTRVAEGELKLGTLKTGSWRRLSQDEIQYLKQMT